MAHFLRRIAAAINLSPLLRQDMRIVRPFPRSDGCRESRKHSLLSKMCTAPGGPLHTTKRAMDPEWTPVPLALVPRRMKPEQTQNHSFLAETIIIMGLRISSRIPGTV